MYASKSFCNVTQFLSNVPGHNSPIGELTTYGSTFSREVGVYQDPTTPGFTLYNFKSATDGDTGAEVPMDPALVNASIGLMQYLVNQITSVSGEIYADQLLQALVTYGSAHGISQITIGAMQQYDQVWAPDWVKFKFDALRDPTVSGDPPLIDNENTIWIPIEAFATQYTEYEIVVVPPIDNLDLFFGTGASVENMINAITTPQIIDRIQQYTNGFPPTISRSDEYNYVNPLNSAQKIPVNWPVLIYGPAGNNVDAIKQALIDYILAHSTHSQADWTKIFPDIFKRTEFLMVPFWQNYAIANRTQAAGVYSPISLLTQARDYIVQVASAYPPDHVNTNASVMGHPYRSMNLMAVGGPDNRDNLFKITDVYPDYINVSSTQLEFARMSPETQAWALRLADMIILAETMTEYTTLPQDLMKMKRGNLLYIVKTINNIQYLVATKRSIYDLLGLTYE